MTLGIESTVDCVEGENEPLSLAPGFKALDISFSSSDGKMKMACWHCCPDCGVSQSDCRAIRLTWRVVERLDGGDVESGEYRQAGSISAELMAKAQELANGSALDAKEEAEAKGRLWAPA